MKITSFNPLIVTKDEAPAIELFEALGFERRHEISVVDDQKIKNYRMKDANGNHVDVSGVESLPRDITTIRINVDNFDEAYEMLINFPLYCHVCKKEMIVTIVDQQLTLSSKPDA